MLNIHRIHERYMGDVDPLRPPQVKVHHFRHLVDAITAHLLSGDITVTDYLEALVMAQLKVYEAQIREIERLPWHKEYRGSLENFRHITKQEEPPCPR